MDRRKYLTIMSSVIVLSFMLLLTQKIDPGWYFKIMIISAGLGVALLFCYFWIRIVKIFKRVAIQDLLFTMGAIFSGLLITTLLLAICKPFLELTPAYYRFGLTLLIGSLSIGLTTLLVRLRMKELKAVFLIEAIPTKAQTGIRNQLKVVDTSAIIDGRIADLCKTGFLEGVLIIPTFVIAELQKIADSADTLRRNRGRRGLDLLNRIQKEKLIATRIFDRDYEDLNEVDTKLLRLAREIEAKVVTNDFNLNKVAEIYGVQVLNINELSNAIKPAVLPGEEMAVHVLRDGKEMGQGIGYLEDGTMIVVEGGKDYIGLDIEIQVTSVLQTAAGRMIFAKPKEYLMVKITS